jgi:hypothetical protein
VSETEIATGRESVEALHGYKPLEEDKRKDDDLTAREAAAARAKPTEAILTRSLDLPENVTLTMEQAGEKLSEARRADKAAKQVEEDDKLAQKIDAERGEIEEAPKAEKAAAPESDDEHVEKLIRKHPKVAEKIVQHARETEAAKSAFRQATDTANNFGRAALLESFPELASLPATEEAWWQGLVAMSQREPERFLAARKMINRVGAIEQMQARLKAHDDAEFKKYVAAESQKFAERHRGEKLDPNAVMETLKGVGVDPATFLKEYDGSRFLRSAEAQAIMVKAAKYDALMKKQDAARNAPKPKPAQRPVPPVVRPGASQPRANHAATDARTAMGKLEQTGRLEDAVRAINAKRAAQTRKR